MKTDELKKLVEAITQGPWRSGRSTFFVGLDGPACMRVYTDHPPTEFELTGDNLAANARLITAAPDLARKVIALREAAKEVVETHMLTGGGSPEAWAKHCAALATLRAVLGESE
jgi:hypothetical protein